MGIISLSTLLCFSSLTANLVYSQTGGLKISPIVQWSFDIDGVFSYCVYEGTVTLDSVNDPQPFCIIPNDESSFENVFSNVNDGVDTYSLDQIETPRGLFKDGSPYSVCVALTPSSPNAGFNTAESCQTFTNKLGKHIEEPFINLDDGVFFTNTQ